MSREYSHHDAGVELLPDPLAEAEEGDPVAVRTENDRIASGVISEYIVGSEFGQVCIKVAEAVLWDVEGGVAEPIELDQGTPEKYRRGSSSDLTPEDWEGPKVSIGITTRPTGGGAVISRPEPVYDTRGLWYYNSVWSGEVKEARVGGLIAPTVLLKHDERPPTAADEVKA